MNHNYKLEIKTDKEMPKEHQLVLEMILFLDFKLHLNNL